MRVIQVIEAIDSQAGAVELLLRGLFDALRNAGVESPVVHVRTPPSSAGREADELASQAANGAIPFDRQTATRLFENADLVHLHGWGNARFRQSALIARKTGTPYVISPCGALSNDRYTRPSWRARLRAWFFDRTLVRRAAAVTAVNDEELDDLRSQGLNATVELLPYGLSFSDYAGGRDDAEIPEARSNGRRLLVLGPIHPSAGFVPILRALAELGAASEGWELVLAGPQRGEWRQMLEAAVRRKGAADRMKIVPAANLAAQRAWLGGATILADPSLCIRGPVSILQAIASGVPVLASTRVAPPRLEQVIRVCRPRREAFKEALEAMFELTAEQRGTMAAEARELGRARFDWSVLARSYVGFYGRMI